MLKYLELIEIGYLENCNEVRKMSWRFSKILEYIAFHVNIVANFYTLAYRFI